MRKHRSIGLRIGLVAALLSVGVALSACTPPAAPAPTVSWSPSKPAGSHEDTDWIKAIRAYKVELAEAINTHDFTSPELIALVGTPGASLLVGRARSYAEEGEYYYLPGPEPFNVIEITESADSAVVRLCEPGEWVITAEKPSRTVPAEGHMTRYDLVRNDEGDVTIDTSAVSERTCDLTGVSVGLFDPQPDVTRTYSPDDVKEIEDGWRTTPSPGVKGP